MAFLGDCDVLFPLHLLHYTDLLPQIFNFFKKVEFSCSAQCFINQKRVITK